MNKKIDWLAICCLLTTGLMAQRVRISGKIAGKVSTWEKLTLRVWDEAYTPNIQTHVPHRVISSGINNGQFNFEIDDVKDIIYFSIGYTQPGSEGFQPLVDLYPAEPSDNLQVDLGSILTDTFRFEEVITPVVRYYTRRISWSGKGAQTTGTE